MNWQCPNEKHQAFMFAWPVIGLILIMLGSLVHWIFMAFAFVILLTHRRFTGNPEDCPFFDGRVFFLREWKKIPKEHCPKCGSKQDGE